VVVLEHQFTPHGLMYEIKPFMEKKNEDATSSRARRVTASKRLSQKSGVRWLVAADTVRPIPDETKMVRVNSLSVKSKPF